jgi:hypothetical protein
VLAVVFGRFLGVSILIPGVLVPGVWVLGVASQGVASSGPGGFRLTRQLSGRDAPFQSLHIQPPSFNFSAICDIGLPPTVAPPVNYGWVF